MLCPLCSLMPCSVRGFGWGRIALARLRAFSAQTRCLGARSALICQTGPIWCIRRRTKILQLRGSGETPMRLRVWSGWIKNTIATGGTGILPQYVHIQVSSNRLATQTIHNSLCGTPTCNNFRTIGNAWPPMLPGSTPGRDGNTSNEAGRVQNECTNS